MRKINHSVSVLLLFPVLLLFVATIPASADNKSAIPGLTSLQSVQLQNSLLEVSANLTDMQDRINLARLVYVINQNMTTEAQDYVAFLLQNEEHLNRQELKKELKGIFFRWNWSTPEINVENMDISFLIPVPSATTSKYTESTAKKPDKKKVESENQTLTGFQQFKELDKMIREGILYIDFVFDKLGMPDSEVFIRGEKYYEWESSNCTLTMLANSENKVEFLGSNGGICGQYYSRLLE